MSDSEWKLFKGCSKDEFDNSLSYNKDFVRFYQCINIK